MENYKNSTSVIARPSIYGGRMFVKYNSKTKKFYTGNTASTAVSENHSAIIINGVLNRELKDTMRQLKNLGYTEYRNNWGKNVDTYKQIHKAGL